MRPAPYLASILTAALASSCSPAATRSATNLVMKSAYRPQAPALALAAPTAPRAQEAEPAPALRYQLLAGDLHCHIQPPDRPSDVDRGIAETVSLAAQEELDFVVFTPHVPTLFFQSPMGRRAALEGQRNLREAIARHAHGKTTFIPGMEYTDWRNGHVGMAFADLEAVFAATGGRDLTAHPERFFERYVEQGGVLVINHPFSTPLDSFVSVARADLSWRPFTYKGPLPAEVRAINRLAQGYEAYNLAITHLRDRFLMGDTEHSITRTLDRMDREIIAQRRRIIPAGGSDSHTHYLRATTFVWSRDRSEAAIREALVAGRVCVRSPEACSLEVRAHGKARGPWVTVGGALFADALEARASGEDIEIFVNGARAARPATGEAVTILLARGQCSVIRARVGDGYSAPIYANCDFAGAG